MKNSDLCRTILRILESAGGFPLSEDVLQEHVNARLRPTPPKASFDDAIETLRGRGHIKALEGEFGDEEARWTLTELGEAWIASRP